MNVLKAVRDESGQEIADLEGEAQQLTTKLMAVHARLAVVRTLNAVAMAAEQKP